MPLTGPDIKHYLKDKMGLRLEDVAMKLGMTFQNLSYHLRKKEVTWNILLQLKEAYGIDFISEKEFALGQKPTTKKDTPEQKDPFWPLAENTARIIAIAKQFQEELKEVRNNVAEHTDQIQEIVKTIGELNKVDGRLEKELKELKQMLQAQ